MSVTTQRASTGRETLGLLVVVGCQLLLVIDSTIVNVALPAVRHAFDLSGVQLSWVLNAYALPFGGLLLLAGRVGDVLGRRRMLLVGVAVFTVASAAGGFAPTGGWLLAARALQGVGAALAAPSTLSLILANFEEGAPRRRALAAFSAVAGAGGSIGVLAGGLLVEWTSWRWVMFVNVPFGLAILVAAPFVLAEAPRHPARFDVPGAVLSVAGVLALVRGLTEAAGNGWSRAGTWWMLGTAVVVLVAFVARELRAASPLLPLRVLTDRSRGAAFADIALLAGALFGLFFYLSQFLQEVSGLSALQSGLAFCLMTVPLAAAAHLTPRLVERVGARTVTVGGIVLIGSALGWLGALDSRSTFTGGLLGPLVLSGLGIGVTFLPLVAAATSRVPDAYAGAASGLLQTLQRVGGSIGLAVLVTATASSAGDVAATVAGAFRVATVFCVLALVLALAAIPGRSRQA